MDEKDKDSIREYNGWKARRQIINQLEVNDKPAKSKQAEVNINISRVNFKIFNSVIKLTTQYVNIIPSLVNINLTQIIKLKKLIESKKVRELKKQDVIEYNFFVHGKQLKFAKNSLFVFKDTNCFRQGIVWLHESKYFEILMILTIIANTVILSMQDYRFRIDSELSEKWRNDLILNTEIVFSSLYIFEFTIKVIGMGLVFEKGSYLRDSWNILDFIIVCSSIVNLLPIPVYFMGLKTLRILRPLRSINSVKGLKVLMSSLLDSLPALGNVVLFLVFTIIVFSILGLQLFNGIFASRCRLTESPVNDKWVFDVSVERLCSIYTCPSQEYCGNMMKEQIYWDRSEINYDNFQYGYATFDNMGFAFLTVFQILTTEGWSKFIFAMIDGYTPAYVYTYFIFLIVFGSFFMVNLILAVINDSFVNQQEQMNKQQVMPLRNQTSICDDLQEDYRIDLNELPQYQTPPKETIMNMLDKNGSDSSEQRMDTFQPTIPAKLLKKPSTFVPLRLDLQKAQSNVTDSDNDLNRHRKKESQTTFIPKLDLNLNEKKSTNTNTNINIVATTDLIDNETSWKQLRSMTTANFVKVKVVQNLFTRIIKSNVFLIISMSLILGNTIVLCLDKYPQSEAENNALDIANIVFTFGFLVEMILKILGLGFKDYISEKFNLFDTLIVVISLVDFSLSYANLGSQNFSILAAFRTLRLFRVFKLARSWVTLRNLISVITHTFRSIQHFFTLLVIFVIISALIGMELFAYQVRFINKVPTSNLAAGRSPYVNFDTFENSLITIFILLTTESWNLIMYDHIRTIGIPYCAYFIGVLIIGNYILLKLFMSILFYNFSETSEKEKKRRQLERACKFRLDLNGIIIKKIFSNIQQKFQTFLKQFRSKGKNQIYWQNKKKQMLGKFENKIQSLEDLDSNDPLSSPQTVISNNSQLNNRQASMKSNNNINLLKKALQNRVDLNNKPILDSNENTNRQNPNNNKQVFFPSPMQSGNSTPMRSRDSSISRGRGSIFQKNSNDFFEVMQQFQDQVENIKGLTGTSLFIFPHTLSFRKHIFKFTFSNKFEYFVILLILISCVMLVLDSPFEDPDSQYSQIIFYINYAMTVSFIFESLLKIISLGFIVNGPHSYLRSFTNAIDFIIVCLSSMDLFAFSSTSFDLSAFKVIRILRILRPLRIISRSEGLKIAMNSLILSLPSILNLQIIICIVFLLFGIFGVNYFKGNIVYLLKINHPPFIFSRLIIELNMEKIIGREVLKHKTYDILYLQVHFIIAVELIKLYWIQLIQKMIALIQVVIGRTKILIMIILSMHLLLYLFYQRQKVGQKECIELNILHLLQTGINHRGIDLQPKLDTSKIWAVYYISFIFIGSFFLMNLFVGIIVDSFQKENEKQRGIHHLTEKQNFWVQLYGRVLGSKPKQILYVHPTASNVRKAFQKVIEHPIFDKIVLLCVLISTASFMMVWDNQDQKIADAISYINIAFVYAFAVEALLKIFVYGLSFIRDPWNILDLCVAIITTGGIVIEYFNVVGSLSQFTSIFLLLRVTRILRIVKKVKNLRIILNTIIISLPSLMNIGSLLFILLFMYSILGINLFAYVKLNESDGLHEKANFQTFFSSFFTLLKISTGEEWDLLMDDLVKEQGPDFVCFSVSNYNDYKKYGINGCGTSIAVPYLISFQILFSMIVLSLFIAVILEGYNISERDENSLIKPNLIEEFQAEWGKIDPYGLGFIQARYLYDIMEHLDYPFGWQNLSISETRKNLMMACLGLPLYNVKNEKKPYVNYYDLLERTIMIRFQEHYGDFEFTPDKKIKVVRDLMRKKQKLLKKNQLFFSSQYTSSEYIAILIIQTNYQIYQSKQMEQFEEQEEEKHQVQQSDADDVEIDVEAIEDHTYNLPQVHGIHGRHIEYSGEAQDPRNKI